MAASWLRINEMHSSNADYVCIVARVQATNAIQRTLILCDMNDGDQTSSSTLNVSFTNVRTLSDCKTSDSLLNQYVQVYGKVVRQDGYINRVDAQFIRELGTDFDINQYVKGLILIRGYIANVDSNGIENEASVDNSGNPIHTLL